MTLTIDGLLRQDSVRLVETLLLSQQEARLEVHMLLARSLGVARVWLIAHDDAQLSSHQLLLYQALLDRRLAGEPMAYILGEREFYGMTLHVNSHVLIPRPDTELLVEQALAYMPVNQSASILDLGTGSGAIALAIAQARPLAQVLAVDISEDALQVAIHNAVRLSLSNVVFLQSNWWRSIPAQKFDLIVSNPPYVAKDDQHVRQGDLRFEPIGALTAGVKGLDDLRCIISAAPAWLAHGNALMLEHGWTQAESVRQLLVAAGFSLIATERDLSGCERMTHAVWKHKA